MLPNVASDRLIILNKGFHSQPEKCPLSVEWNPNINIYIYIWKIDNYEDDHSYFGRINHNPKIEMWWNGFVWHLPNCATILGSTLVDESWWRVWEFTIVHHSPPARSPAQNMKCKHCKPTTGIPPLVQLPQIPTIFEPNELGIIPWIPDTRGVQKSCEHYVNHRFWSDWVISTLWGYHDINISVYLCLIWHFMFVIYKILKANTQNKS